MPGPYCLCNGKMRCCSRLAGGQWPPLPSLGAFDGAADEKSFVSLLITDGAGTLTCGGETVKVKKGESYFIPAGSGKYAVTGDCETLVTVV